MATIKQMLTLLCLALPAAHVCAEEQSPVNQQPLSGADATASTAGNVADTAIQHLLSIDGNLEIKKAGTHGMLGTRAAIAIQPVERHRLKLYTAYFSNDRGAASDGSDSSFGLGDFFSCLFGSCPDEDYSSHSGGNYFFEYEEQAVIYQYQLSRSRTGEHSYGEIWIGAGPSKTERTTKRYQIDNGENYDVIDKINEDGVAWAMDFVNRHNHWYWQASLAGSTSSGSVGGTLGLGVGF